MKTNIVILIISIFLIYSCKSNELVESQKNDYATSGILSDDCFQVIITVSPDREMLTMTDQRENAFIKAKGNINVETEKQILLYYSGETSLKIENIPPGKIDALKNKSRDYSAEGIIDQEYYLFDNSAVLIYRIFKKGIKNEIINN